MLLNVFFALFPALSAGLSGYLALQLRRRNTLAGVEAFSWFLISIFVWSLCAMFGLLSPTLAARQFFSQLELLSALPLPVLWLVFSARYTRRAAWLTPRAMGLLWLIPLLSLGLGLTNSWHGLIWQGSEVAFQNTLALNISYGSWSRFVLFPYSYALILAGFGLLGFSYISDPFAYRRRTRLLITANMLPFALHALALGLPDAFGGFPLTFGGLVLGLSLLVRGLSGETLAQTTPISYRTVFFNTTDGVILLTRDYRVTDLNPAAATFLELEAADVRGRSLAEVAPLYYPLARQGGDEVTTTLQVQQVGRPRFVEVRVRRISEGGRRVGKVIIVRDITKEKEQQAELERFAYRDSLTGLPNRRQLTLEAERALSLAARYGWPLAFLYIDLDKFKVINDSYGHEVGDQVLVWVAECLNREVREGDTVARIGGDEFAALLYNANATAALETCYRLLKALSKPISLNEERLSVAASIGIASYPLDGANMDDLLRHADTAMYRAKQGEGNIEFYSENGED